MYAANPFLPAKFNLNYHFLKDWAVKMLYKSQNISSGYLKCKHNEIHPCTQTETFLLNELSGQIFQYKNITMKCD